MAATDLLITRDTQKVMRIVFYTSYRIQLFPF